MPEFRQQKDADARLYAEETDAPLPETLNPKTRYAYFSTIAKGGKSLIKSCRDLHLRGLHGTQVGIYGLAIAKKIPAFGRIDAGYFAESDRRVAELLGGRIEVTSELEQGSCFRCLIPLRPLADASRAAGLRVLSDRAILPGIHAQRVVLLERE